MNELKKIKFKIKWKDMLLNKLHINPKKLCRNCGKLEGSHVERFGSKNCCYPHHNDSNRFSIKEI